MVHGGPTKAIGGRGTTSRTLCGVDRDIETRSLPVADPADAWTQQRSMQPPGQEQPRRRGWDRRRGSGRRM